MTLVNLPYVVTASASTPTSPNVPTVQVGGHVVPASNLAYDLGSSNARWRDLYLSGNTIDLGGTFLKRDETGGGIKIESESGQEVDTNVRNVHASGYVNIAGTRLERHVTGPIMVKTGAGEGQMESGMFKHVYVDGTANASNVAIVTGTGTESALSVKQYGTQPIVDLWDANTLAVRVADGGNVGIGTGTPLQALHVQGAVQAHTQFLGQQSDTVASPSFSWAGDTNTGFYLPAADQIGVVTTGAERMRVTANGNMGIGVANPLQKLHVDGNILATGTVTASNLSVIGDFVTMNTVTSNTEQVVVTNAGTGPALKVTQTGANSIAEFYDDGGVLALKVADGGNVGIGTATPTNPLTVWGASRFGTDTNGTTQSTNYGRWQNLMDEVSPNQSLTQHFNRIQTTAVLPTANRTWYNVYNQFYNDAIGSTTDTQRSIIYGTRNYCMNARTDGGTGHIFQWFGTRNWIENYAGATAPNEVANAYGTYNDIHQYRAGTTTNAYGTYNAMRRTAGTLTNSYGVYVNTSGTIANSYGVYCTGEQKNYFAGNVGIGTATPLQALHVQGNLIAQGRANFHNGSPYAVPNNFMAAGSLTIGGTDTNYGGGTNWNNGNAAGLMMECQDITEIAVHDAGERVASLMYYEGGANNRIYIGRDMGWGTTPLYVQGNMNTAGYLTQAGIPAFYAKRNTSASTANGYTGIIIFPNYLVNNGNCFNGTNGRFTAPVSGVYKLEFAAILRYGTAIGSGELTLVKNTGTNLSPRAFGYSYVTGVDDHDWIHVSVMCPLNYGDYVEPHIYAISAGVNVYYGQNLGYFMGHLIG